MHVEELMAQADAYAARDYRRAYQIERDAYEHMFTAGTAVAKAGVTPEVAVGLDAPPDMLRSDPVVLGQRPPQLDDAAEHRVGSVDRRLAPCRGHPAGGGGGRALGRRRGAGGPDPAADRPVVGPGNPADQDPTDQRHHGQEPG